MWASEKTVQSPEFTWWKERNGSHKMSSYTNKKIKVSKKKKKTLTSKCYGNTKVSKVPKKIEDNFTGSIWNDFLITESEKKKYTKILKHFLRIKARKYEGCDSKHRIRSRKSSESNKCKNQIIPNSKSTGILCSGVCMQDLSLQGSSRVSRDEIISIKQNSYICLTLIRSLKLLYFCPAKGT